MNPTEDAVAVKAALAARYRVFEGAIRLVRAPYRICPLGAHIDHQLGPVTAMALDKAVWLAFVPSADTGVRLQSLSFPGEIQFDLRDVGPAVPTDWGNYARGAAQALQSRFPVNRGIWGVTAGFFGEGGLSSSAAIGVAYLLALAHANDIALSSADLIELDRVIENEYLGLNNGILDQSAIVLSRRNSLLYLDCKTRDHRLIPAPALPFPAEPNQGTGSREGFSVLIAFSGLSQPLVSTGYNQRVAECRQAAAQLLAAAGRTVAQPVLAHIEPAEYAAHCGVLSGALGKRAAHFFGEVSRVEEGIQAFARGDWTAFGQLMNASGRSSIELYECGCRPLIDLYELLVGCEGVYGARFSGAGFRGCCLALVRPEMAEAIAERVRIEYRAAQPDLAERSRVMICTTDNAAEVL